MSSSIYFRFLQPFRIIVAQLLENDISDIHALRWPFHVVFIISGNLYAIKIIGNFIIFFSNVLVYMESQEIYSE